MKKKILISTGGSGGHVVPAIIFYEHLKKDYEVYISTDLRGTRFLDENKYDFKIINTPKFSNKLLILFFQTFSIIKLIIKSIFFLKEKKIDIMISTGGYMSLPICLASKILNIKIYLFEPNYALGKANKFFLNLSEKIFCYSDNIKKFPSKFKKKIVIINSLLRKDFYNEKNDKTIENKLNLLIIGGSQGAKLFDSEICNVVLGLSKDYKIKIFHQTNLKNYKSLKNFYSLNNIESELFDFNENILRIMTEVNLCITRAGASTLAELAYLNIPFLTIPLILIGDDHQSLNAEYYKNLDCCWILSQNEINQRTLTDKLTNIIENHEDYLSKKKNMKKFTYQNTWNDINQKIITTINEN